MYIYETSVREGFTYFQEKLVIMSFVGNIHGQKKHLAKDKDNSWWPKSTDFSHHLSRDILCPPLVGRIAPFCLK